MPTYQYRCSDCGQDLEVVQKFTDAALTECPNCTGRLRKIYNAVGVVFKGSGFYSTDNRNGSKASSSADASSGGSSSDSKSESSTTAASGSSDKSSSAKSSSDRSSSDRGSSGKNSSGSNGSGSSTPAPAKAAAG